MATYHPQNIPWVLISEGLERRCYTIQQDVSSDFHNRRPRKGRGQKTDILVSGIFPLEPQPVDYHTQLQEFVQVFSDTIEEYTKMELEQYPETHASIEDDEIIIDDQNMKNIADYSKRWLKGIQTTFWLGAPEGIKDGITLEQRKTCAFFTPYVAPTDCYGQADGHSHFQLEIVKSLLIRGEMHTLLRMCCHPEINYFIRSWKCARFDADCGCGPTRIPEAGWNQIYIIALHSFICLNILKQFPRQWRCNDFTHESHDYKSLNMYQDLIKTISDEPSPSSFHLLPHREFFGTDNSKRLKNITTCNSNWRVGSYPPSAATIKRGLDKTRYSTDIQKITLLLSYQGLPGELIDDILQRAGYHAPDSFNFSVTSQADDPLSPENAHLLDYYLDMCWDLIIRCSVMLEVLGRHDPRGPRKYQPSWQGTIARILYRLVPGVPHELIKDCQKK